MIIFFVLLLLFGLGFLFAKSGKRRPERTRGEARMITATIIDYFHRSGVDVSVGCITLDGSRRYTAFIESEPMKRFRLSHIVEATLSEYVKQTCKLDLEKIYWRFPIKEETLHSAGNGELQKASGIQEEQGAETDAVHVLNPESPVDDYIHEGLMLNQHLRHMVVTELSWEKFQEVAATDAKKNKR
jgi:hypothetical protein